MTEVNDAAIAEIAGRMFDGDLVRQPQRVQDRVWRDARAALFAALAHLTDDGVGASTAVTSPVAEATSPPAPSSPHPYDQRAALEDEVREALQDLGIIAYPTSARNDAEEPLDIECVVGHVAGYVAALLRGAS